MPFGGSGELWLELAHALIDVMNSDVCNSGTTRRPTQQLKQRLRLRSDIGEGAIQEGLTQVFCLHLASAFWAKEACATYVRGMNVASPDEPFASALWDFVSGAGA